MNAWGLGNILPRRYRDVQREHGACDAPAMPNRFESIQIFLSQMVSKGRLYIGLGQKYWIQDDSLSCSIRFVPGALEAAGFASGSSCVISDFVETPGETIFSCTSETRTSGALELVRLGARLALC